MKKVILLIMTVFALNLASCVTDRESEETALQVGDWCPDFSVELIDGGVVSTASLRGATSLICFFNTECGDCRKELPMVQQAYERLTAENDGHAPNFVCIARSEGETQIRRFWFDNLLTMPVSAQPDATVYHLFASIGIPRIFIISPEGTIAAAWSDRPLATADEICAAFNNLFQ